MKKPMLQIALDNLETEKAIEDAQKARKYLDVIEVGTILISSQGKQAIKDISNHFSDKIIVADGKIADAGAIFGNMFFRSGAQFTTAICAAETATIKSVLDEAKKHSQENDVQIELTSHFTWKQVEEWKSIGVSQVVYHRSRDAQASGVKWSQEDLNNIKKLSDLGFKVSVTGGIEIEDIKFFKGLPVYIFIAGRTIRDANNPQETAKKFQEEINRYW